MGHALSMTASQDTGAGNERNYEKCSECGQSIFNHHYTCTRFTPTKQAKIERAAKDFNDRFTDVMKELKEEEAPTTITGWQEHIPQAILGALEYRGFYDCGKYLDDTLIKAIEPIISTLIAAERQKAWLKGQDEARCHYYERVERETRTQTKEAILALIEKEKKAVQGNPELDYAFYALDTLANEVKKIV